MDNSFDEYSWESKIQSDEKRINTYLQKLPENLDLASCEDKIFKQLEIEPYSLLTRNSNQDEVEDYNSFHNNYNSTSLWRIDKIATKWNVFVATKLPKELKSDALIISCAFGKLISRIANYNDSDEKSLQKSLIKHSLIDLNELYSLLENFNNSLDDTQYKELFKLDLQILKSIYDQTTELL